MKVLVDGATANESHRRRDKNISPSTVAEDLEKLNSSPPTEPPEQRTDRNATKRRRRTLSAALLLILTFFYRRNAPGSTESVSRLSAVPRIKKATNNETPPLLFSPKLEANNDTVKSAAFYPIWLTPELAAEKPQSPEQLEDHAFVESLVERMFQLTTGTNSNNSANFIVASLKQEPAMDPKQQQQQRCAFLFHGLPRAFRDVVLPSLVLQILIPNALYNCDIFVTAHERERETAGRSGEGGTINAKDVHLLQHAAEVVQSKMTHVSSSSRRSPTVLIETYTDADFYRERKTFLQTIKTTTDSEGVSIYIPRGELSYNYETIENVARMWHGIQGAWGLMERHARQSSINYGRVGLFRSDVFYATPIHLYHIPTAVVHDKHTNKTTVQLSLDRDNQVAVIPGFAKTPVNDRMFYGPYQALKVYATERFDSIHNHTRQTIGQKRGGMHSESVVAQILLPEIQQQYSIAIAEDFSNCFVRARADNSIWASDCDRGENRSTAPHELWEPFVFSMAQQILGRTCVKKNWTIKFFYNVSQALCFNTSLEEQK